jgi:hypothetical protein
MIAAGVATSELGIGVALIAAGGVVTAHGVDTVVSGVRTAAAGSPVDTVTSGLLQAAGMSRRGANLVDALIGVIGTLGATTVTKAPAVANASANAIESGALVHRTTHEAAVAIEGSQQLGLGAGTVYAGPAALATASPAAVTARTGLLAKAATDVVPISSTAAGAFRVPAVVGPATAWQRLSGTVLTPGAGSVNLLTGAFTRTGIGWNQAKLNVIDSAIAWALRSQSALDMPADPPAAAPATPAAPAAPATPDPAPAGSGHSLLQMRVPPPTTSHRPTPSRLGVTATLSDH